MIRPLLVIVLLSSACASSMSPQSRRTALVLGTVTAVGGLVMMKASAVDSDHNGVNETWLNDDLGMLMLGTGLTLGGIVTAGSALVASDEPEPKAFVREHRFPDAPPGLVTPGQTSLRFSTEPPRLPELPSSAEVLQLAQQVRSIIADGHCDVAWVLAREIETRDRVYARALTSGPVFATCR